MTLTLIKHLQNFISRNASGYRFLPHQWLRNTNDTLSDARNEVSFAEKLCWLNEVFFSLSVAHTEAVRLEKGRATGRRRRCERNDKQGFASGFRRSSASRSAMCRAQAHPRATNPQARGRAGCCQGASATALLSTQQFTNTSVAFAHTGSP